MTPSGIKIKPLKEKLLSNKLLKDAKLINTLNVCVHTKVNTDHKEKIHDAFTI